MKPPQMNAEERRFLTRRGLLALAAGLPFARLRAVAQGHRGKVKITAVKAMQIRNIAGNCLIKIETDAGLVGYGEAGVSGPMARSRIAAITERGQLIGQDPLRIEYHFHQMTTLMHPYMAHYPSISGIDMALWDLAGKITGLRVVELLGGPFRDAITMYSHGSAGLNMLDPSSCREWAKQIRSAGEGFRAFKINVDRAAGVPAGRYTMATLTTEQVRNVGRAFANVREAVGEEIDIAVHCHNEFDAPSALAVAKAVEPMNPLFLEDPLPVPFSESWMSLKRSTRIPILTGEKLEMIAGFRPFLDHQGADIIHPDLAFAGGITGTRKVADYSMLTRTPVALHNVGSLVLTFASAHFGAAIQNFYRSESALGRPTRHVENMAASNPPEVRNGMLKVPEGPGLGLALNEEYLKSQLVDGEKFWS